MNFIPGLELNRSFFKEVIQPLLEDNFKHITYSAALMGYGSDVLGVDNETSMDHNWGPRCIIFLSKEDIKYKDQLDHFFSNSLPFEHRGFPTNYTDPRYDFTQKMKLTNSYPIKHLIEIHEIEEYFNQHLNISDIYNIKEKEWLTFNDQVLLELISGEVYYDGLNCLTKIRETLSFYPPNISKIRLASLWLSIWNEEPFIGRCIENNDFIGLKLISSRIVATLMKILFYLDNRYIPYSKWFGTIFSTISTYNKLQPMISDILTENNPEVLENNLCKLYSEVITLHNSSDYLPQLENKVQNFFNRPYKVIFAESIVDKLMESHNLPNNVNIDLNKIALDIKVESIDFTE